MLEYAKFYGFQNGVPDDQCLDLFKKVEQTVIPDPQVVTAFMATVDNEPAACAMSNTKLIFAGTNQVHVIPVIDIGVFYGAPHVMAARKNTGDFAFDIDPQKANEIMDFLMRSLRACQEELAGNAKK